MESKDQYSEWVEQARSIEIKKAHKRIAQGEDIDQVLESFSRNFMKKLLHPVLQEIRNVPIDLDALEQSKVAYYEKMKIIGPRADHVKDDDE
jgi:glutamyl-tRNA reductase